jgi:hypothetical protein
MEDALAAECGEIDALHPLPEGPWILSQLTQSVPARSRPLQGVRRGQLRHPVEVFRLSGFLQDGL